jgi:hypothetical protein
LQHHPRLGLAGLMHARGERHKTKPSPKGLTKGEGRQLLTERGCGRSASEAVLLADGLVSPLVVLADGLAVAVGDLLARMADLVRYVGLGRSGVGRSGHKRDEQSASKERHLLPPVVEGCLSASSSSRCN